MKDSTNISPGKVYICHNSNPPFQFFPITYVVGFLLPTGIYRINYSESTITHPMIWSYDITYHN